MHGTDDTGTAITLAEQFRLASADDDPTRLSTLRWTDAVDLRDVLITLLEIYDLWMAPLQAVGSRAQHQSDPSVVLLKRQLEEALRARLDSFLEADAESDPSRLGEELAASAALRRIAAIDLVPAVYEWLAEDASFDELVEFVTLEGGPDAGFDDLVALCQVGLRGLPKLALAANYWDEMGRGELDEVHTVLHDRLVAAVDMPHVAREQLPVEALERMALGGYLATNRALQPEMVGALGLLEMQAGPRCRKVVRALQRLDAPSGALPFYEEHARADPIHGRDWIERAVEPLDQEPGWGPRIVTGARWRSSVNRRFFDAMARRFVDGAPSRLALSTS